MSTKLGEYLKELDPDKLVCIGSKQNFMYFGKAGDLEQINKVFEDYKVRNRARLKSAKSSVYNLVTSNFEIKLEEDVKDLKKRVWKKAEKIYSAVNQVKASTHYENVYKPVLERQIKEKYDRTTDAYHAIIVTGFEQGSYWWAEEYQKDYL